MQKVVMTFIPPEFAKNPGIVYRTAIQTGTAI